MSTCRLYRGGLAAVLTSLALVVSGCAGHSSAAPERNAAGQTVVRFQDPGVLLSMLPLLQAKATGAFAAHGIELSPNAPLYNANQIVQSLLQGQADIAVGGGTAALAAVGQGQQVRIIATMEAPAPMQVTLTNAAIATLAGRGITPRSPIADKLGALRGLSLSAPASGSTIDQMLRSVLTGAGLSPDRDVVIQPIPDGAAVVAAARQRTVDGLVGVPASTLVPVTDGWGQTFIDFASEAPESVDIPYSVAMSTPRFIQEHPDVVRGFLQAIDDGKRQAAAMTPASRTTLRTTFFPDMPQVTFDRSLETVLPTIATPLTPTQAQHDLMLKMAGTGPTGPTDVTFDQLYETAIPASIEQR